ncbi:MAG: translation initiation factor IF-2 [Bacteroidales bacterium]
MSNGNISIRLIKAAKEFNIGIATITEFLSKKGHKIDSNPNTKLTPEMYALLVKEFQSEKAVKETAMKIELEYIHHLKPADKPAEAEETAEPAETDVKTPAPETKKRAKSKTEEAPVAEPEETETPVEPVVIEKAEPVETPIDEPIKQEISAGEKIKEKLPEETATVVPEAEITKKTELPVEGDTEKVAAGVDQEKEPETKKRASVKIVGKIDLDAINAKTKPDRKTKEEKEKEKEKKEKEKQEKKEKAKSKKKKEPKITEPEETVVPEVEIPVSAESPIESAPIASEQVVEPEPVAKTEEPEPIVEKEEKVDPKFIPREKIILEGPVILGSIELPVTKKAETKKQETQKPAGTPVEQKEGRKKKRKRIKKQAEAGPVETDVEKTVEQKGKPKDRKAKKEVQRVEPSEEEIQRQIKETLQRLSPTGKSRAAKYRREKRQLLSQHKQEELEKQQSDQKILKVTEFVTANELATMMNLPVNQVIAACLSLGLFVSINQRLDAETLVLVAEEFGFKVEFVSVEVQEAIDESTEVDNPEDLVERHPVVTVMGHVDHGKTSLLDYIRHSNVIAGEAGGITQHIGAYEVQLENGKKITFLDTPGHEAFTAMRARGTKITDIAIIVVAADDHVMPQTVEAINHALAAGIPIVIAINKIDKPTANPDKVREELSKLNILVEEWGGKYQSQEISAKKGINIDLLLDKVLLEAELLDLKANPNRNAKGSVIESSLDKGRGYVAKILVENGTLKVGDVVLAGTTFGRVKAMYNERNQAVQKAGPATPVLLLGLNGAPQAGDQFNVLSDEREAKNIALKRQQLQREQGLRTQKHITLDEIGRRIAIGDFKELNIIVKGDVDGSVEALADSLLKLSAEQVQVNVIHKSVGAITESDVLLASASNAIIIGFQVRPTLGAKKLAETEQIDIRLYSIIYQVIDEIKAAIEGMLSPEYEEKILSNIEVREIFKITKVGTVAGCMVLDGKLTRNSKIRLIRDGIVIYTGKLGSLRRFKDDVKEVFAGQDCGLNIENFNDIKVGDIIESYEMIEIKRKV